MAKGVQNIFGVDTDLLVCYGCAHSASGDEYPGQPSGERPCGFCLRNRTDSTGYTDRWYNGAKPTQLGRLGVPGRQDNYVSIDISREHRYWDAEENDQDPPSIVPRRGFRYRGDRG